MRLYFFVLVLFLSASDFYTQDKLDVKIAANLELIYSGELSKAKKDIIKLKKIR